MLDRNTTPMFTKEQVEYLENMCQEQITIPKDDRDTYYNMGRRSVIYAIHKANEYHRKKALEGK